MSTGPINQRISEGDKDLGTSRVTARKSRFRFHLPSPFVFSIVLVFVVLPLVWPDSDEIASVTGLRASFQLTTDVCSLAISSDASRIAATCRDDSIARWNRRHEREWDGSRFPSGHIGGARCLAFAPDGNTLAAGNFDGTVTLWDLGVGMPPETLATGSEMVNAIAFSPDGRWLAAADSRSRILLWTTADRRLRERLEGHASPANVLAFASDGRHLASGGEDRTVRLWDLDRPGRSIIYRGHPDVILALAFSPDGRWLASSSLRDHEVRLWNTATGESRDGFEMPPSSHHVTCLAFSPDGRTLLLGTDRGRVWFRSFASRTDKATLEAHVGWVKSLAVTADGKTLVTGGNDGFVRAWDVAALSGK